MKQSWIPSLISVSVSLVVVWFLHGFILSNDCAAQAGSFDFSQNLCRDDQGDVITQILSSIQIALYCVVIVLVCLVTTNIIRKLIHK